jgi:DNA modification methylase
MTVSILCGDCRDVLRQMPDASVHCVVTSPPYWGLRDYGIAGQLGLETSLGEYIEAMVAVFREVRRVLRKDGTLWLNLGDSYATSVNGRSAADTKLSSEDDRTFRDKPFSTIGPIYDPAGGAKGGGYRGPNLGDANSQSVPTGRICAGGYLKPKDLCGIPWRLAFALQEDGWWLRQDIIWSKPNPMPESITDRCTKAHEYLFLLTKSERYHYDAEAIKEPATYDPEDTKMPDGWDTAAGGHGSFHRNGREKGRASGNKSHKGVTEYEASESEEHRTKAGLLKISETAYATRNKRSVWEIATQPFSDWAETVRRVRVPYDALVDGKKRITSSNCPLHGDHSGPVPKVRNDEHEDDDIARMSELCGPSDLAAHRRANNNAPDDLNARPLVQTDDHSGDMSSCCCEWYIEKVEKTSHFATFPPALIEPCIKAGTSEKGCCGKCGAPWKREVERTAATVMSPASQYGNGAGRNDGNRSQLVGAIATTLGWSPSCACNAGAVPCTVLDPFAGAGTTGLVADRLQRNAILIELKPEYAAMARRRIEADAPLFTQVDEYNATDDFARSIDEAYRVIRERKANGGPGWGGWE